MEFEEMKKIWNQQNNEPMYAINETALHRSIRAKRDRARHLSNINDIGLIIIAILTSVILLLTGSNHIYDYLSAVMLLLIAGYVLIGRRGRKRVERHFDRSMLGDLDHAIANVNYEIKRNKTFIWWFMLPVGVPMFLNLVQGAAPSWKWLIILPVFLLAFGVVQWELRSKLLPRRQRLEALRNTLTQEVEN